MTGIRTKDFSVKNKEIYNSNKRFNVKSYFADI